MSAVGYYAIIDRYRGEYLRDCMRRAGNNVRAASKLAAIHRTHFYKLLQRYAPDIKPKPRHGNEQWRALQ